ncbi:hypothetical protein BDV34DRAFT_222755 [Aspergillus parasiticus]|uniref:Terpene synthase metal-binding domain-containing protein n=1 Tax=Aspergillus parasiticus TaxID=5067 RepID=A0A5N6DSX6_ASPPA|nr:hypothetical protein BDV34DRAFT_222755 [Aspergillus parasiticus]
MDLERNCSKQISVVNDIWSWEKEVRASQSDFAATKRLLQAMVEEWNQLTAEQLGAGCRPAVKLYMKGLEYQTSGHELWSRTTLRYVDKDATASS